MKSGVRILAAFAVVLATAGLAAATVVPSAAQEERPPLLIEPLSGRAVFTGEIDMRVLYRLAGSPAGTVNVTEPSRTITVRLTLQPGYVFPWHTHPGPVFANVVEGKLIYVNAGDCVKRSYPAGTAFVDPGQGNVHTAYNAYYGETVLIATFYEVTENGPLSITEGILGPSGCNVGSSSSP